MADARQQSSYWTETAGPVRAFPRLSGDLTVDVAVIGGGIVGVTAARCLKDLGLTAAVLEARRVGQEVTGRSTAKISSQHGLVYVELVRKHGEARARLYGEAQETALREIQRLAARHAIACDLEEMPAFTYTCERRHVPEIEQEVEVARRLGLPASVAARTDLPFGTLAAIRFAGQAQFHPVKYVAGLASSIPGEGCHVFENSRVIDWEPNRVATAEGSVSARHVIMATHLPLGQVGGFYASAFPYAEPVIAGPIARVPGGMYLSVEEPSHSIRTHVAEDGTVYGIAAGSPFKPGYGEDERSSMEDLEDWFTAHFASRPVTHRWINEDYTPMDGAPFAGWSSHLGTPYLVATGFRAWGITNGTAAAMLLADLAAGEDNPWHEVFDARRVKPLASAREFLKENLHVAADLAGGYLARRPTTVAALEPGEGAVIAMNGKRIAAYRGEAGTLHAHSAICTHMGCVLGWNRTDRTWDCPCHGSRYDVDGEVLHGPAVTALKKEDAGE
jgi:glycine/D-amino acid oxidase-like deaminating enzyme/nitrite reductase/ring-hydroxylating ferredoxin subunit